MTQPFLVYFYSYDENVLFLIGGASRPKECQNYAMVYFLLTNSKEVAPIQASGPGEIVEGRN